MNQVGSAVLDQWIAFYSLQQDAEAGTGGEMMSPQQALEKLTKGG